jgi:magnesium chelatase family protein
MALGSTLTTALDGVTARPVTVEANIGPGLPGIHVVGLGDAAVRESRDRIRTAVANARLDWPKTKIVISMSPAAMPKSGSHFDLPISLAVLSARHPGAAHRLADVLVLGELGLDGSVHPVTGVLPALLTARRRGIRTVLIPPGNAAEAALVHDLDVRCVPSLAAAWGWATEGRDLPIARPANPTTPTPPGLGDFADVAGQPEARFAAEVAAAGAHHMLMIGPPGSGKSMIAQRLPGVLPTLTVHQAVEATAIHSVAGAVEPVVHRPPFVAPHHSVTRSALLGGGSGNPRPGAISLAHHGVLFLDEASEIPARVLDSLRTPLEHGRIKLSRARSEVMFPAQFQLILAANPCRCGAEEPAACRCTSKERTTYLANLSGPLRDRLDIGVRMHSAGAVLHTEGAEDSATIAARVAEARERSCLRWSRHGLGVEANGHVESSYLRRHAPADDAAMALLGAYLAAGDVSQRGVDRALKVAWSICDVEGDATPTLDHVARAVELRAGTGMEVPA